MAIYFIRSGDFIKIGYARAPWVRFWDIQTANPNQIEMLAVIPGDFADERKLHSRFSEYRYRGEWFNASDELLGYAAGLKQEHPGLAVESKPWKRVATAELARLSSIEAASLVANMALEVRDAGHDVIVRHALVSGKRGILVFMPGFELVDGNLRLVTTAPAPQEEPTL